MGSLSVQTFQGPIRNQWAEVSDQSGKIIKNNFTDQEFRLFSIPNHQNADLRPYFTREISVIAKTPKIMVLERQKDQVWFLAEHAPILFTDWLRNKKCELSMLIVLRDVCSAFNAVKSKYGAFVITERMLRVTRQESVLVWFNERFESNLIQLPLNKSGQREEKVMLQNIIQIFKKNYQKNKSKIFHSNPQSFKQLKQYVQKEIEYQESLRTGSILTNISSDDNVKVKGFANLERSYHCSKTSDHLFLSCKHPKHTYTTVDPPENCGKVTQQKLEIKTIDQQQKILMHHQRSKSMTKIVYKKPRKVSFLRIDSPKRKTSSKYSSNESPHQISSISSSARSSKDSTQRKNSLNVCLNQFIEDIPEEEKPKSRAINFSFKKEKSPSSKVQRHSHTDEVFFKKPEFGNKIEFPIYKPADSFSSKKNFSLKSTSGTVRRTKQFEEALRVVFVEEQQVINEQSDETVKASMKGTQNESISLSEDFEKLFSAKQSVLLQREDTEREKEFSQILFD